MVDSQFSPNACSSRVNLGVEKSVDTCWLLGELGSWLEARAQVRFPR